MQVGGAEVFQEFDPHLEGLIRIHSPPRAETKELSRNRKQGVERHKSRKAQRIEIVELLSLGNSGNAAAS